MIDAGIALELARPKRPRLNAGLGMRKVRAAEGIDFDSIPMHPGDPGWQDKVPPPDPGAAGEEPLSDMTLDSLSDEEKRQILLGRMQHQSAPEASPPAQQQPVDTRKRAGVYIGRGDAFVLAMETPPDWDSEEQWKYDGPTLLQIIGVLKAFDIRVIDKTGGELNELRERQARKQTSRSRTRARTESPGAGAARERVEDSEEQ